MFIYRWVGQICLAAFTLFSVTKGLSRRQDMAGFTVSSQEATSGDGPITSGGIVVASDST